jgi:hypothetical protein
MAAVVKTPWDNRFVARGHSNSKIGVQICPSCRALMEKDAAPRPSDALRWVVGERFRGPIQCLTLTMTKLNCGA